MTIRPEALEPHQQRLLPTTPDDVPPDVRDELGAFCAESPEVEAGYVCRVERVWPGREPQESLSFILKLARPISVPEDARPETRAVCDRFIRQHPNLARQLGVGVLADRAIPAWEKNGQKVYSRQGQ